MKRAPKSKLSSITTVVHKPAKRLRVTGTVVLCRFDTKDAKRIEKAAKKRDLSLIEFIQSAAIRAAQPISSLNWSPEE